MRQTKSTYLPLYIESTKQTKQEIREFKKKDNNTTVWSSNAHLNSTARYRFLTKTRAQTRAAIALMNQHLEGAMWISVTSPTFWNLLSSTQFLFHLLKTCVGKCSRGDHVVIWKSVVWWNVVEAYRKDNGTGYMYSKTLSGVCNAITSMQWKQTFLSSFHDWILFEELCYCGNQRIVLRTADLAIKLRKKQQQQHQKHDNFKTMYYPSDSNVLAEWGRKADTRITPNAHHEHFVLRWAATNKWELQGVKKCVSLGRKHHRQTHIATWKCTNPEQKPRHSISSNKETFVTAVLYLDSWLQYGCFFVVNV